MYEYKVYPAPVKGQKAKGLKTAEERFANALEVAMNDMATDGWEYVRAETLPAEERSGLTSKVTRFHNVLVFRRLIEEEAVEPAPVPEEAPEPELEEPSETAPAEEDSADPFEEPESKTETPSAKAAQALVAMPPVEADTAPPRVEMMGILRSIKGDRVPAKPDNDASATGRT